MRILKLMTMLLVLAAVATSCEKEGPAGPAGPSGSSGTDGEDGNASVTVYGYGETILTAAVSSKVFILPVSGGMADSSIILPYYYVGGFWYQAGEMGYGGAYLTRYYTAPFLTETDLIIQILDNDGTAYTGIDETWDSLRVFVIPANIFITGMDAKVDPSNYQAVSEFFTAN